MLISLARRLFGLESGAVTPTADSLFRAATAAFAQSDLESARDWCERALAQEPRALEYHALLCQITLPGPTYADILGWLHAHLRPRTYMEIGVWRGDSIRYAQAQTRVIGIDPAPQVSAPLPSNTTLHVLTSDAYFSTHDVKAEFGGQPIDLAFIDGLHLFEAALRDFINIERHSTSESTILIHDVYPLNRLTAEREMQMKGFWSGDIWRLILLLKKYRPDLAIASVAAPPTGLAIVRGLDPLSRTLSDNYDAIVEEFSKVDYGVLDSDKAAMLNLFPNDSEAIKGLFSRA